jgi:predicted ester cyclase
MRRPVALVSVTAVLVFGVLATVGRSALAQDATPAACPTTTEEENVALITQFYADVDADNDVAPYFAAEHTVHLQAGGVQENVGPAWFADRQADFPDLALINEVAIGDGDLVAVLNTWAGTQEGPDDYLRIPATGQQADWLAAGFFRIECGKIVELWSLSDQLGLLRDVGLISDEEIQSAESMATPTA